MNVFRAQFSTGQVVQATGVANAALQSWLKRRVVVQEGPHSRGVITGGSSPGFHRRYSFYNVMEIAVAKALLDRGLCDLGDAFRAARQYAHIAADPGDGVPARIAGLPFNGLGETVLAVSGEKAGVFYWPSGADLLPAIKQELGDDGFAVIFVGVVFDRVVTALGFHPEAVLEAAYAGLVDHGDGPGFDIF